MPINHGIKVIIEKSRGGRLLWNRNWDCCWSWASWQYWKKEKIWADYEQILRPGFNVSWAKKLRNIWNKNTIASALKSCIKWSYFWPRFYIVVLGMTFFFFIFFQYRFTFSNLYMDFSVPFIFGLFFPFSIWTFLSLFYLDFYFPFLYGRSYFFFFTKILFISF